MSIKHMMTKDGKGLVSTATVNGREVEVRLNWKTPEEAAARLEQGKRTAEKHFKTMIVNSANAGTSKNAIRKIGTIFGREITLGFLSGNAFTSARFSFGKTSFIADILDGHIDWNTMRKDHRNVVHRGNWVFGYGGASKAVFLRIRKTA